MSKAFASAVRLLARREHSAHELLHKLQKKGHCYSEVQDALAECQRLGLQSDERFVQSICRMRMAQGYGPLKIRQELQSAKVDRMYIDDVLQQADAHWTTQAMAVWKKKFNTEKPLSREALQKQQRFLLYRGFSSDIIAEVFKNIQMNLQ